MRRRRTPAEGNRRGSSALPAKASAPRFTNVIPRARLFRMFDRALARGAIWVAAPAGAGKTAAVASYLAARGSKALWYDVDATDVDVANVFLYLTKGLRSVTRSRRRLPAFQVQHLGSLRAFARKFFESLYASLEPGSTLVLDNCQAVADSAFWSEILEEATRAVPDGRALILVSRTEPPSRFSRQIVIERLALVSGNDLRFSDVEARTLARQRVPRLVRRRPDEVARLCALADGWAAGLALVLDHAARAPSDERAPALVQHDERLFDYFSSEVLGELPAEAQHVLLATAHLPCMTERMASDVSGAPGATALLADLHRRGLLVERLATEPPTYRYHPLFRAFLLARERRPAPELLARAAAACVAGGFLDEGIDLHARAGQQAEVAGLIGAHASRLVAEGRYGTLGSWLGRLDERAIASEPWLRFWQATANLAANQAASREQFTQAYEGFRARGDAAGLYLTIAGAVLVIFVEAHDFRLLDPWFARFDDLRRDGPPPPSDEVEATALAGLLMAVCYARPSYPDAGTWATRALELEPRLADAASRARLWAALMMFTSVTGRFEAAHRLAGRRPQVGPGLDPITRMVVAEAEIHHAMSGSQLKARAKFREALALARGEALQLFEGTFLAGAAQAAAIAGDEAGADELLRQAVAASQEAPSAHLMRAGLFEYSEAMVAFARLDFAKSVLKMEVSLARNVPIGMRWGEILSRPLYAIALDALGRHEEADREVARMTGEMAPVGAAIMALDLFAAERRLRDGGARADAERAASRALEAARACGSFAFLYLRALPHLLAFSLRSAVTAIWVAEQLTENRVRPWAQHLDLAAWPFAVRVRTLGGFALEGEQKGRRSRKVSKAPLRLLKCLVAAGPGPLPVAAATDALWPDDAPAAARRQLDTTLHRLRKMVGEDVVRLVDGALAIDRERCFVDAWAFAALAARAERVLRRGGAGRADSPEARAMYEDAVHLYRGPLLQAEDDLPPLVVHGREALRRRFAGLVQAFAGAVEARAAAAIYERALEVDELAEPLTQGLMRAYLELGRSADVAREYRRCERALRAALGAQPAPETRALYEASRKAMMTA